MAELEESEEIQAAEKKRQVQIKPTDIIVIGVVSVVIIGLLVFIIGRLNLKREVTAAKVVSDKVIADMAKQDTSGIRLLGDKSFQEKNSAKELSDHLTATDKDGTQITFAQLYGDTKPKVDQQVVTNNERGQHVTFIYRYDKLKAPFFVRIDIEKKPTSDKWTLQGFSASPGEANLTGQ